MTLARAANDDAPCVSEASSARGAEDLRLCMAWILREIACGDVDESALSADLAVARARLAASTPRPRPTLTAVEGE